MLKVTGDNVSLRAKPATTAEVVGKVSIGDSLTGLEQQGEWFRVALPTNTACWVAAEFIVNGITVDRVNVRCGPSRSYNSLGVLARGTKVEIRQQKEKWFQIAPQPGISAWITTSFVIGPQAVVPVAAVPATTSAPAPVPATPTATPQPMPTPQPPPPDIKPQLAPQASQGQASDGWEGVLESGGIFRSGPAKFRLVKKGSAGETLIVCYLRGNQDQLASLKGRRVRIQGREYWLKEIKEPLVVPESIVPMD